jgi:hypothetical protein
MPAVALGRAVWTQDEVQHLDDCRLCRQEFEIVRAASRLGGDLKETLDPDSTAVSVLQRLRTASSVEGRRRTTWTLGGFAAAAAIAFAIWTGSPKSATNSAPETGPLAVTELEIPLPELDGLQAAELDSVLRTMDEPNVDGANLDQVDLSDLSSDELERVLDSWEG